MRQIRSVVNMNIGFLLLLTTTVLTQGSGGQGPSLNATDVARIEALYRLTDTLGAALWPGFDARTIPVAVNSENGHELLIGHPRPPAEFRPVQTLKLEGRPVLMREGRTRYMLDGGGTADIAGVLTAYVSTIRPDQTDEEYLSLLLHECFHVFLHRTREGASGRLEEPPELDPAYAALLGLESHILLSALEQTLEDEARHLGRMFVAVRHERRRSLSEDIVRLESENEANEGTASYVQGRGYQLLADTGLQRAGALFRDLVAKIVPPQNTLVTFSHGMYKNGMAQGLLLDRLRPRWKAEMHERGMTEFAILERELLSGSGSDRTLVDEAKRRFGFDGLLAEQTRLVNQQKGMITSLLEGPGRRYRVYWSAVPGPFDWMPKGPLYKVPPDLMAAAERAVAAIPGAPAPSVRTDAWIVAGGIRHLDIAGLRFQSNDVPMLFRQDYVEWIDRTPATDGSDCRMEWQTEENGVYVGLIVTTRGFALLVPRARIDWTKDVVSIRPVAAPMWRASATPSRRVISARPSAGPSPLCRVE